MSFRMSGEIIQRVTTIHERGKALASQARPLDAIRVYDEAISIAKGDPGLTAWIRFDKGKTLTNLGKFGDALSEFQKAHTILGENTWVYTELGNAKIGLKQLTTAETEFNHALSLNPDNWEASQGIEHIVQMRKQAEQLHVQGVQRRASGDNTGALESYQRAIDLVGAENTPWSVFDVGKTYVTLGRFDEAISQLQQAKEFLPGVIWPDIEVGNVYLAQKNIGKAEAYFHTLEQLYPQNEGIVERFAHINKLREEAEFFHVEGVRLRSEGNYQEALHNYQLAINTVGEQAAPWTVFDIGKILTSMGNYEEALRHFEQAKEFLPGVIWPDIEVGNVYLEQKDLDRAQIHFQQLANSPLNSFASQEVHNALQRVEQVRQELAASHQILLKPRRTQLSDTQDIELTENSTAIERTVVYTKRTARELLKGNHTTLPPLTPFWQTGPSCFYAAPLAMAKHAHVSIPGNSFEKHARQANVLHNSGVSTHENFQSVRDFILRETNQQVEAIDVLQPHLSYVDDPPLRGNISFKDLHVSRILPTESILMLLQNNMYVTIIVPWRTFGYQNEGFDWFAIDQAWFGDNGELYFGGMNSYVNARVQTSLPELAEGIQQASANGRYIWAWRYAK